MEVTWVRYGSLVAYRDHDAFWFFVSQVFELSAVMTFECETKFGQDRDGVLCGNGHLVLVQKLEGL